MHTTSCKVLIPHLPFVDDVKCPCDPLGRYVYVAIWVQRGSCDPKNLLIDNPSDVLGLQLFPELGHGSWGARPYQLSSKSVDCESMVGCRTNRIYHEPASRPELGALIRDQSTRGSSGRRLFSFMSTTIQTLRVQDLNDPHQQSLDTLTTTLNALLKGLRLCFVLGSPSDLTPSMLLAILECILEFRLPLSREIRESKSHFDKVEAMKIFLGVLETDIVKMDVGLGDVDPRALARGEEPETVFVGELLCWLGQKSGILPLGFREGAVFRPAQGEVEVVEATEEEVDDEDEDVFGKARDNTISSTSSPRRVRVATPSTRSSLADSANTILSMVNASHPETDTSVMTMSIDDRTVTPPATPRVFTPQPSHHSAPPSPQMVHPTELPETHIDRGDDASYCDCSLKQDIPIQHTGWTRGVDHTEEVRTFLAKRSENTAHQIAYTPKVASYVGLGYSSHGPPRLITRHTSPSQHRLALLNEKARLLTELANLNISTRR